MTYMEPKIFIRRSAIAITAFVVIGFLGLLIWGMLNRQPITGLSGITMVKHPAPDFNLTTFEGKALSLADLKGQPAVINFWASWCPPCRDEAPILERTWRAYENQGLRFVGINIQDRKEDALSYIREFDITYPNGPDPAGEITIGYGVSGLPVTFFVSGDGKILRRWVGAVEPNVLVNSIKEIMQ